MQSKMNVNSLFHALLRFRLAFCSAASRSALRDTARPPGPRCYTRSQRFRRADDLGVAAKRPAAWVPVPAVRGGKRHTAHKLTRKVGGCSMQKIVTSLWFDGRVEEALEFYTSIFANSRITSIIRYGDAGPGPKGEIVT